MKEKHPVGNRMEMFWAQWMKRVISFRIFTSTPPKLYQLPMQQTSGASSVSERGDYNRKMS